MDMIIGHKNIITKYKLYDLIINKNFGHKQLENYLSLYNNELSKNKKQSNVIIKRLVKSI